jgi:hypothetical protein
MATQTVTSTGDKPTLAVQPKLQRLREVYADAPEVGRVALEKIMGELDAAGWYVANPNLTVAETRRLERVGKAVEELLDKIG